MILLDVLPLLTQKGQNVRSGKTSAYPAGHCSFNSMARSIICVFENASPHRRGHEKINPETWEQGNPFREQSKRAREMRKLNAEQPKNS